MNYLINYNNIQNRYTDQTIHNVLTNLVGVTDWWHYIPNSYIVTSTTRNAAELADQIIKTLPGLLFIITNVNFDDYSGILNKAAWDWINKKAHVKSGLKPIPNQSLPPIGQDPLSKVPRWVNKPIKTGSNYLDDILNKLK